MKAKLEDALKAANLDVIAVADTDKENLSKNRPRVQKPGKKRARPVQSSRPTAKRPTETQVSATREYDKALKEMVDDTVGPEAPGEALARYEKRESALGKDAKMMGKIAERDRKLSNKWEAKQQKYWQNGTPTQEDLSKGMEKAFSRELERNEPLSESDINKRYFGLADMIFAKGYSPNDLREWKPLSRAFPGAVRDKAWPVNLERRVLAELEGKEPLPPIVLPHEPIAAPAAVAVPEEDWDDGSSGPMTRTDIASVNPGVVESIRAPGQHRAEKPRVVTKVEQKARRSYDRALGAMAIDAAEPGETAALDSYKSALRTMTEEATEAAPVSDGEITELDVAPVRHDSTPVLPADKFKDATPKSIRESLRRSILSIKEVPPTEMPAGAIDTLPPNIASKATNFVEAATPKPEDIINTLPPELKEVAAVVPEAPEAAKAVEAVVAKIESSLTPEERAARQAERDLRRAATEGHEEKYNAMRDAKATYLRAYHHFHKNHSALGRRDERVQGTDEWRKLAQLKAISDEKAFAYQSALQDSVSARLASDTEYRKEFMTKKARARYYRLIGAGHNAPRNADGTVMKNVEDYIPVYLREYEDRVAQRYGATVAWKEVTVRNAEAETQVRALALGAKQKNVVEKLWAGAQGVNKAINTRIEEYAGPGTARAVRIAFSVALGTTTGVLTGGAAGGLTRLIAFGSGLFGGAASGYTAGGIFQRFVADPRIASAERARQNRIGSVAQLTQAIQARKNADPRILAAAKARVEMAAGMIGGFGAGYGMTASGYAAEAAQLLENQASEISQSIDEILSRSAAAVPAAAVLDEAGASEETSGVKPAAGGENGTGRAVPVAGGEGSGSAASLESVAPVVANNPGPAGSPFGRIPVPTDSVPQPDLNGRYVADTVLSGSSSTDLASSEGLDDMRAVAAEVRGASTEYVARSGDGGIKLVEGLQKQLAREGITETTPGISEMTREIASADTKAEAEAVARKYGLYQPGVTDESAVIGKEARIKIEGEKLVLTDAKGEAVFIDDKNPYSGRMFDSNPPPPVRESLPETRASGERVAPSEAPPPAQREVVSSTGQEQIVPREEPPRVAGQTKSYWDMTEVEKTQHLNRLSIADARQARLDWEDYARKYDAYLEEVARERGVPAAAVVESAPVASTAPIERDLPPVRVDASPTPAPAPAPAPEAAPSAAKSAPEPVRPVPSPEGPPRDTISTDEAIRQFGDPQAVGSRESTPAPAASESITTDEAINQLRAQKK